MHDERIDNFKPIEEQLKAKKILTMKDIEAIEKNKIKK